MKSNKSLLIALIVAFLLGAAFPALLLWNPGRWAWADRLAGRVSGQPGQQTHEHSEQKQLWTCGMHPQVIQDEPGNCPICGMRLVPVKETAPLEAPPQESKERKIKYWRAPMDPNYISDKPGKSPMGMDLVPVYEDEESLESGIRVDPNFLQNFAVRTAVAEKGSIPVEIRTVGILAYNQKNIVSVNTKIDGWIEKANVNYIGEQVRRGEVLFEIYSPALVTTQREYLAALDYVNQLASGGRLEAVARARALLEATRERLRYWDVTDSQIDDLEREKRISRTLKIFSPVTGTVTAKMGDSLEGMKLAPGMNVYKIADLSTVWAEIEVFEHQIQHLRLGQTTHISLDAFPGRHWMGKIIYIDPAVNPQTRTLKASVEIANPDGTLRPAMYANIEIRVPAGYGGVKVPQEVVLRSGERAVVIVQKSKGLFEPREVQLGTAGGGYQEVRHGLKAGETVVASSQFLIDSESNLKEAISKMLARSGSQPAVQTPPPAHQH